MPVLGAVLMIGLTAAPAEAVAAMSPEPAAAPAVQDKPKPKRPAAKRAPRPAPEAATAVPAPVINPKYNDVMTAVVMRDHAGAAEILQAGAWADRSDSYGETPLMLAAKQGDPRMTALLLEHGANPNRSGPAGNLHAYAGMGGNGEVVKLITKAGTR